MFFVSIIILGAIFMVYHFYYDIKIWLNGGSLIEGNENMLPSADDLRTIFDRYDTDGSGTIERSELHKIFRDFGEDLTSIEAQAILALIDSDSNEKINFEEFMNWILSYESSGRQSGLKGAAGKEAPATSAAEEEAYAKTEEKSATEEEPTDEEDTGTVTINYCDVIDEKTMNTVLSQITANSDSREDNVRLGKHFIEVLKNVRNLDNVPSSSDTDLEFLGSTINNLKNGETENNSKNHLKKEIIKSVCSMVNGINSNKVEWDTPKLEIKQTTSGMFDDTSNTKFNQGEKATENSTKLEEQGLCLWKGCHRGDGKPLDSIWSVY